MSNVVFSVSDIVFSDRSELTVGPDDIVVLVGPNNSGKSAALREVLSCVQHPKVATNVVKSVRLRSVGKLDDLLRWLNIHAVKSTDSWGDIHYHRLSLDIREELLKTYWPPSTDGMHSLAPFFICLVGTEERLTAANPAKSVDFLNAPLEHPIHHLQADEGLEAKCSSYFRRAFGVDLILNRSAGGVVPLHCGTRPEPDVAKGEDRLSSGYLRKLGKLPQLKMQGDGMRGFTGILLHALAMNHFVVLLDEPEAFLHPPQARLLGKLLIKESPRGRQTLIATHSSDLVKGLLDANDPRVRILRLTRTGEINPVKELSSEHLKKLWSDPLLRYSNIFDGLFHRMVVVCESDSDCRFYSAVLDAIDSIRSDEQPIDVLFIHCGGKDRLDVAAAALACLAVDVRVVTDFDCLNDEQPLRRIFESVGGRWSDIEKDWKLVKAEIEHKKPELETDKVRNEIQAILSQVTVPKLPDKSAKEIEAVLKRASPWSVAKSGGRGFVPPGNGTQALDRLLAKLKAHKIFVVQVGELESFCRSVGNHGPKWVNEVLKKDLRNDQELDAARKFVATLVE